MFQIITTMGMVAVSFMLQAIQLIIIWYLSMYGVEMNEQVIGEPTLQPVRSAYMYSKVSIIAFTNIKELKPGETTRVGCAEVTNSSDKSIYFNGNKAYGKQGTAELRVFEEPDLGNTSETPKSSILVGDYGFERVMEAAKKAGVSFTLSYWEAEGNWSFEIVSASKEECKSIKRMYRMSDAVKLINSLGEEIKTDHEGRLLIDPTKEMKTWEGDVDLENCTIRELEMFKIGFKHGQDVERRKK